MWFKKKTFCSIFHYVVKTVGELYLKGFNGKKKERRKKGYYN